MKKLVSHIVDSTVIAAIAYGSWLVQDTNPFFIATRFIWSFFLVLAFIMLIVSLFWGC